MVGEARWRACWVLDSLEISNLALTLWRSHDNRNFQILRNFPVRTDSVLGFELADALNSSLARILRKPEKAEPMFPYVSFTRGKLSRCGCREVFGSFGLFSMI